MINLKASKKTIFFAFATLLLAFAMLGVTLFLAAKNTPQDAVFKGDFTLTTHEGVKFTQNNLQGKPSLLFFGFTHCPDVCPTALQEMSDLTKALGNDAKKLQILFFSVDPERDTPAFLKDYLTSFTPNIIGLTGSVEEVNAIVKLYRVYAKKIPLEKGSYTMDHTSITYLLDKKGNFIGSFDMKRNVAEQVKAIKPFL